MFTISSAGPTRSNFHHSDVQHSSSGRVLSAALSAADPKRIYAGSYAGVWRSDDGGQHFRQLSGPLTASAGPGIFGSIYAPHIFDLAVSDGDPDLVLAAARDGQFNTNRDGIYRSTDGGHSWELVLGVVTSPKAPIISGVSQVVFAPDDPMLVFAALGTQGVARSIDGGKKWTKHPVPAGSNVWHIAVAPKESASVRKVYAAGDSAIFFSHNSGNTWAVDKGAKVINDSRKNLAAFQASCGGDGVGGFAGISSNAVGEAPKILAVEPGDPNKVYLAVPGGSFGPSYYRGGVPDGTQANTICKRLAGEGSLWYGDFSQFGATGGAVWLDMPGAPLYDLVGNSEFADSPSGNVYVITKATSSGFLVFFSDMNHVHVSQGVPNSFNSWHRLGGKDASESRRDGDNSNIVRVHADPHALILTPDFEITLKPSTVSSPYDQNSELDQHISGNIWMASDGGLYQSTDGGTNWKLCDGLETLDPINIAGLFGLGNSPALYFGCGDNDDFFTRDGGQNYYDPVSSCGDCDAWFADVAQPGRLLQFEPRFFLNGVRTPMVNIVSTSDSSEYPDASDGSNTRHIPAPRRVKQTDGSVPEYTSSDLVIRGYRPIIRTLATEAPMGDGDYVFIHSSDGVSRKVLRTTSISSITQLKDWDDVTKAQVIGVPLPITAVTPEPIVQASGGHTNPVFFVSDGMGNLFKWDGGLNVWRKIVPGGPTGRAATGAISFFVDPFHPEIVYLVDQSGIKVSLDGGESWLPELGLSQSVTAGGKINAQTATVITDMVFSRGEANTRFVFGDAGVFCTINGFEWLTLLDSVAIPGRPESGFFDPLSDPSDRALYVELEGRSILRIGGIPGPPPFQPPPVYDLLEFAALDF